MIRPLRPIELLTSLWSATAMVPVNSGAAAAYRTLFFTVRRLVLGRRLTVRLDDGDLTMTVTTVDSRLDVGGLAVGQLNDVTVAAENVVWRTSRFECARVVLHNVYVKPGVPPVLTAAPVEVAVDVPSAALGLLFRTAAPRLSGEVSADGVARVRLARQPWLGHVEVAARVDGATLVLTAGHFGVGARTWRLPSRTPAYRVQLPELAQGLQVTAVTFGSEVVRVSGVLPQWHAELPPKALEDMVGQLGVTDMVLNLTGLRRGR